MFEGDGAGLGVSVQESWDGKGVWGIARNLLPHIFVAIGMRPDVVDIRAVWESVGPDLSAELDGETGEEGEGLE